MLIVRQEALTGDVPRKERSDLAVIHAVLVRKEYPTRPLEHIPQQSRKGDQLWDMLERCWSFEPARRPKMPEVRDSVSVCMPVACPRNLVSKLIAFACARS
jgi:hypothetical protein